MIETLLRDLASIVLAAAIRRSANLRGGGRGVGSADGYPGGGAPLHGSPPRGARPLSPEPTMAQRVSRAKQRIKASGVPFAMPDGRERAERLGAMLHVLYLIFNGATRAAAVTRSTMSFAYESLADDPVNGARFAQEFERLARNPPPMLSLTSLVIPEETADGDAERLACGTMVAIEDGREQPVSRGLVNVVLWTADRQEIQCLCGDDVNTAGRFDAVIPSEIADAVESGIPTLGEALCLGTWPWAESRSGTRWLR